MTPKVLVLSTMNEIYPVLDIADNRLSLAKELGADHVIKVTTTCPQTLAKRIVSTMGSEPEVTVECSGTDFSFITGIHVTMLFLLMLHECI